MQSITAAWQKHTDYFAITAAIQQRKPVLVAGLPALPAAALIATLWEALPYPVMILTANEEDAVLLTENLRPFLADSVQHFPVLELLPFSVYAHNVELIAARIDVLSRLAAGENMVVVACMNAVQRKLPPPTVFRSHHLQLKKGDIAPPAELAGKLSNMGYERVPLTETPGTFSLRGSILDVFPINTIKPLRIEFFDDEVDSVRLFDPAEQRSLSGEAELSLPPAREMPLSDAARLRAVEALAAEYEQQAAALHGPAKRELAKSVQPLLEFLREGVWDNALEALMCYCYPDAGSLLDYFGDGLVVISEPEKVRETALDLAEERESRYFDLLDSGRLLPSFYYNFFSYEDLQQACLARRLLLLCRLAAQSAGIRPAFESMIAARELPAYAHNPAGFREDYERFRTSGYHVLMTASSDVRLKRMADILREQDLPPAQMLRAGFSQGFESTAFKMAVITESEMFGQQTKRRHRRAHKAGEKISNFLDLKNGDYVVHISQGIGRYEGVKRLKVGDIERDYLLIQYAGEDKLYLPVDQLDLIQKYIGSDTGSPKLYKLGGSEWGRVKAKVRAAVREMADELLKLYAERETAEGFAFSVDTPWQREFEDAFPYTETPDQLTAATEIKADMERGKVMDRLLCGDVGYGKTEIALRAAFKAVQDSKQVAILAPTTVLVQQHYQTICSRFDGYPVQVGSLSRFSTPKEQKALLAKVAAGEVDIVVGTHRLLSADVHFHDLGLLIIDEEQRFGVTHKEKIKKLRTQVDVLTLSATPIPRTLHMALVGMRDMSIINTPPEARFPVQTYVVEHHDRLIRDAIAREMGRGGQVYYVHNRVFDIYEEAERLRQILPTARICVGHGQMREGELEQVMMDFVAKECDVLVCTTIIESGLDIPNVNTLIVNDADTFGLAQLYQLRGRVGRAERQAFAYFTYRRDRVINDTAKKRLVAIRDFTELGSGFKIAMRDLELRGAGNILGPQQHGHIESVGFDLYCKLLAEEMRVARGEKPSAQPVATQIDLTLNAFIPDVFVEDSVLKVEIYKRLAAANSFSEVDDMAGELVDRYGALPAAVKNLLQVTRIKVLAKRLFILSVLQKPGLVELRFAEGSPVRGEHMLALIAKWGLRLVYLNKKGPCIKVSTSDVPDDVARVDLLLRVLADLDREVLAD